MQFEGAVIQIAHPPSATAGEMALDLLDSWCSLRGMRLIRADIKGYRSLRSVEVQFADLTSCIGANGSGKSSLLGALQLFFDPQADINDRDYWSGAGQTTDEVSIKLTFSTLSAAENEQFADWLSDSGHLTVDRRFERGGSNAYVAQRLSVPAFQTIRLLELAHRDQFNELVRGGDFPGLERASSRDDAFAKMRDWEISNPDQCERLEERFDSLPELLQCVNFLSVDAFENPADHVGGQGRGAIAQLLAAVVDQRSLQAGLDEIVREAAERSHDYLSQSSSDFQAFASAMGEQLNRFVPGFKLNLAWAPAAIQSARPKVEITIETADGLARPLEYQGHGVQRALMYAALTAQVEAAFERSSDRILLVIEEPEAFQHPLSCRVLSSTLRTLSQRQYQVIYSTHSPHFVHPDLVEGLRIFHRTDPDGSGAGTVVASLDEQRLLQEWARVFELEDPTTATVLARLRRHLPPNVLEGLFAELCILVEGQEDEAVVRAAATREKIDLDARGVAVIPTSGKPGMPNVLAFLALAGIAVYPIFDLDRDGNAPNLSAEQQIMRALNLDIEPEVGVQERYATCETNMTQQLRTDLGEHYESALSKAAEIHGYSEKYARKIPAVVEDLLRLGEESGSPSPTVEQLGTRIRALTEGLSDRRQEAEGPPKEEEEE